jgi:alanine-synthesizing transaminase
MEQEFHRIKRLPPYVDFGVFTAIQVATTAALNGPQDCVAEMRDRYRARRDVLIDGLAAAGWPVTRPEATMFVWAPLPPNMAEMGSLAFSKMLLERAKVAVAPGLGFGEYGEGFVRLGLVENQQRIRQALRSVKTMLRDDGGATDAAGAGRRLAS